MNRYKIMLIQTDEKDQYIRSKSEIVYSEKELHELWTLSETIKM